jgi:hypothetical protein
MTELELARAAAVALEQECAALSDTLDLFTHEYEPNNHAPGRCTCGHRADAATHRTPAFVRKRYGFGI